MKKLIVGCLSILFLSVPIFGMQEEVPQQEPAESQFVTKIKVLLVNLDYSNEDQRKECVDSIANVLNITSINNELSFLPKEQDLKELMLYLCKKIFKSKYNSSFMLEYVAALDQLNAEQLVFCYCVMNKTVKDKKQALMLIEECNDLLSTEPNIRYLINSFLQKICQHRAQREKTLFDHSFDATIKSVISVDTLNKQQFNKIADTLAILSLEQKIIFIKSLFSNKPDLNVSIDLNNVTIIRYGYYKMAMFNNFNSLIYGSYLYNKFVFPLGAFALEGVAQAANNYYLQDPAARTCISKNLIQELFQEEDWYISCEKYGNLNCIQIHYRNKYSTNGTLFLYSNEIEEFIKIARILKEDISLDILDPEKRSYVQKSRLLKENQLARKFFIQTYIQTKYYRFFEDYFYRSTFFKNLEILGISLSDVKESIADSWQDMCKIFDIQQDQIKNLNFRQYFLLSEYYSKLNCGLFLADIDCHIRTFNLHFDDTHPLKKSIMRFINKRRKGVIFNTVINPLIIGNLAGLLTYKSHTLISSLIPQYISNAIPSSIKNVIWASAAAITGIYATIKVISYKQRLLNKQNSLI